MRKSLMILYFFSLIFFGGKSFAQVSSVPYNPDFKFNEGVYLNFDEFKNNNPSITDYEIVVYGTFKEEGNSKYYFIKYISYTDGSGAEQQLDLKSFWGLCDKNGIFVLAYEVLHPLEKIGALITFNMNFKTPGSFDAGYVGASGPTTVKNKIFIVFETGRGFQYSLKNFEVLISKDKELLSQFESIKGKRKKIKQMPDYVDKYNSRHPISFPLNPFEQAD